MRRSLFITFEGPDGAGKSTQARRLAEYLRGRSFTVIETREPGGTALGERVRSVLLSPEGPPITPLAETFLLSAQRAQHVAEVIIPGLATGAVVISDRFADSTLAYQCYGAGLDPAVARQLTLIATGGLEPDITVLIDVAPEVGLQRASSRGAMNRLDAEALSFHQRVREGYLHLAEEDPARWIHVDGGGPPDDVHQSILEAVGAMLEEQDEEQ